MAAAKAHLPVLERYHAGLLRGAARHRRGRGVSPEEIVVANHYTDLRDLDPDPASWRPAPTRTIRRCADGSRCDGLGGDGCSVIWAETPTGRILAQTWDMHATAIPYVMVLARAGERRRPGGALLTVTGCLGMAGMNSARVAIAINNLFSTDATLGVVWPAMVRRALHEAHRRRPRAT